MRRRPPTPSAAALLLLLLLLLAGHPEPADAKKKNAKKKAKIPALSSPAMVDKLMSSVLDGDETSARAKAASVSPSRPLPHPTPPKARLLGGVAPSRGAVADRMAGAGGQGD